MLKDKQRTEILEHNKNPDRRERDFAVVNGKRVPINTRLQDYY